MLNDSKKTVKLIKANVVIGFIPEDSNPDGCIDIAQGDKVGISCAICHTSTDSSAFELPGKRSMIGNSFSSIWVP